MGVMADPSRAERIEHLRAKTRRQRRRRLAAILLGTPIATVLLLVLGPAPFSLLVFAALGIRWVFGGKRRARQLGDLKWRRHRTLQQGLDAGGPSDKPAARHKSPDPNAAEKELFGRRMTGFIRGAWPHGRI